MHQIEFLDHFLEILMAAVINSTYLFYFRFVIKDPKKSTENSLKKCKKLFQKIFSISKQGFMRIYSDVMRAGGKLTL